MTIFDKYREAPKEWTSTTTGEVISPVGKIVLSSNLIAVESLYSQDLDREHYGIEDEPKPDAVGGGVRGEITEFTRASQTRLKKKLATWDFNGRVIILTLTYPRRFPTTATAKRHFERFQGRLRRNFPELAGMWKLEYQTRGAPHYHLVLETGNCAIDIIKFRGWLDANWQAARGSNIPARTQAQWAKNDERARFYLTKETGKVIQTRGSQKARVENEIEHSGRFWGWHQKSRLVFNAREITLSAEAMWVFRRRLQEVVARDMVNGGRLRRAPSGDLLDLAGNPVDEAGLPTWHLFTDTNHVIRRILKEMAREGYNIPPPDTWDETVNPFR